MRSPKRDLHDVLGDCMIATIVVSSIIIVCLLVFGTLLAGWIASLFTGAA